MKIFDRLHEAAQLARDLEDSPLWGRKNVREGAITIQQQAERYAAATDDETRADAATWAREGYTILSAALPDTHPGAVPDERNTGWITAHDISKLFGPEFVWLARVRLEFVPQFPDATLHDPGIEYLRGLVEISGLSQRKIADRIGIAERTMRHYLAGWRNLPDGRQVPCPAPYPVQYAMEMLAKSKITE